MLCPINPLHSFDYACEECANCESYYDCQSKEEQAENKNSEIKKDKCPNYPNIYFTKGRCKRCSFYSMCLKKFYPNNVKENKIPISDEEMEKFRRILQENFTYDMWEAYYF